MAQNYCALFDHFFTSRHKACIIMVWLILCKNEKVGSIKGAEQGVHIFYKNHTVLSFLVLMDVTLVD